MCVFTIGFVFSFKLPFDTVGGCTFGCTFGKSEMFQNVRLIWKVLLKDYLVLMGKTQVCEVVDLESHK